MATNTVICEGNLVRDPKIFPLKNDTGIVARFTVAVDRESRGADYIDCVAFGDVAVQLNDYARKGTGVRIAGKLRSRSFERAGQKVYAMEVSADTLEITARGRALESTSVNEPASQMKVSAPRASRERKNQVAG